MAELYLPIHRDLMMAFLAAGPDDVTIQVGSSRLQGWQTVNISKSCETMPNSWAVTASAEFLQGSALAATRPGQSCLIYIGSDLVITGWIDRRTIVIDPRSREVTISGRGITRNLVDCSVDLLTDQDLQGGKLPIGYLADIARRMSAPYGVTVKLAVADGGKFISYPLQVTPGETPYQYIESIARYLGFLVYEDETGALVLDQVGTKLHTSGFSLGGNIEAMAADWSVDGLYSDYAVLWSTFDPQVPNGDLAQRRAVATDPTLGEHRVKIIVSEQVTDDEALAQKRATWELNRRTGRSQAVSLTCDSWRDSSGYLWTPNRLAMVDAAAAGISAEKWIIGSVVYRKDMSGTHADLVLMPPAAFAPEPNPLNLFDRQLAEVPQNPAPPTPGVH